MNFKQNFVSYELAKKVIDAGFDWECSCCYQGNEELLFITDYSGFPVSRTPDDVDKHSANYCMAAPMYQQVVDWLRETYGIWIYFDATFCNDKYRFGEQTTHLEHWNHSSVTEFYDTYYEALEAALDQCLDTTVTFIRNKQFGY